MAFFPVAAAAVYEGGILVVGGATIWLQQHPEARDALAKALEGVLGKYHGNSSLSPRETQLYHLINIGSGEIDKIGITSAELAPRGRYTQEYLDRENVRYETMYQFSSRFPAKIAENIELTHYAITHGGQLPRLNRSFQ